MPQVRYIGNKPTKTDNVASTGVVWNGHGDVQSVPDAAWPKLAVHSSVWALVPALAAAAAPATVVKQTANAPAPVQTAAPVGAATAGQPEGGTPPPSDPPAKPTYYLVNADETIINLDAMDDPALRELVGALQKDMPKIKVHSQIKGDKLRAAIVEQVNAAAAADGEGA